MRIKILILFGFLTSCTQVPELSSLNTRDAANAPYPRIQPIADILAADQAISDQGVFAPDLSTSLSARLQALQTRASLLRSM